MKIRYIGDKDMKTDNVAGTRIVWLGNGNVQEVPDDKAPLFLRHPTVWEAANGAEANEPRMLTTHTRDNDLVPTAEELAAKEEADAKARRKEERLIAAEAAERAKQRLEREEREAEERRKAEQDRIDAERAAAGTAERTERRAIQVGSEKADDITDPNAPKADPQDVAIEQMSDAELRNFLKLHNIRMHPAAKQGALLAAARRFVDKSKE